MYSNFNPAYTSEFQLRSNIKLRTSAHDLHWCLFYRPAWSAWTVWSAWTQRRTRIAWKGPPGPPGGDPGVVSPRYTWVSLINFCPFEQLEAIAKINHSCGGFFDSNDKEKIYLIVMEGSKFRSMRNYATHMLNNLSWFIPSPLFADELRITQSSPVVFGRLGVYKIAIATEDKGIKHRDMAGKW